MSASGPIRYRSDDEDSARWLGFEYRPGDVVISTRSKSGTTWMQMICALLVFQSTELPEPLGRLSPWLDWTGIPAGELYARLAAQPHRRIIKTHTPLDGMVLDRRATYIVVGRHPLDMAVSLYHQGANIDRPRLRQLTGQPPAPDSPRPPLHEWLLRWIDADPSPAQNLDSLPGVFFHIVDAWPRRHDGNVVLVHYDDLAGDLEGSMRHMAEILGIAVAEERWPSLVDGATFAAMRHRASTLAPDPADILIDRSRFFRRGRSGAGREELDQAEMAHYHARAAQLAPPEVRAWLHHEADGVR